VVAGLTHCCSIKREVACADASIAMLALVASIHAFAARGEGVDGRDKHGHDCVSEAGTGLGLRGPL
jgi:hypothetical protein